MKKLWGLWICAWLTGCVATDPTGSVPETESVHETMIDGAAVQLDDAARLLETIEVVSETHGAVSQAEAPLARWIHGGAMTLIASDLERRRKDIEQRSSSALVRVSMSEDVDPALEAFLLQVQEE